MNNLERDTVKRVRQALVAGGVQDKVIELADTARSAADAAKAIGCEKGAIVKTLIFTVGSRFVVALVAGDHQCREDQLPRALGLEGGVIRPTADLVRAATGFAIGGVSPVGQVAKLPTVIDASLKRFEKVYAAAGHPHCVFETSAQELKTLTGATMSYAIAVPEQPA